MIEELPGQTEDVVEEQEDQALAQNTSDSEFELGSMGELNHVSELGWLNL